MDQHPGLSGKFMQPALWLAVIGVVVLLVCSSPDRELVDAAAVGTVFGYFLLAVSLIYVVMHAVSTLLYHQELMRSRLRDPDPEDGD